jgi:hypothetical protein
MYTNIFIGFPYRVFAMDECVEGWMDIEYVILLMWCIFHYTMHDQHSSSGDLYSNHNCRDICQIQTQNHLKAGAKKY